jgi:Cupin
VIFPHGDAHIIENGPPTKTVDLSKELARLVAQGLKLARFGGGGEVTKFTCGFMACDPQLSQVFLSGLPPVFKVSIRNDASGRWLENSIRFSANDADASRAGGEAVLAKLAEVLFVETLRAYITRFRLTKRVGWLVPATPRSEKHSRSCTGILRIRGPLLPWQKKRESHVRCSLSGFVITSRSLQWPTSRVGDFSWEPRCWPQQAIRWHRSHLRWAMSPKRLSTVRSNVSSQFLPRVSAANRDRLTVHPIP